MLNMQWAVCVCLCSKWAINWVDSHVTGPMPGEKGILKQMSYGRAREYAGRRPPAIEKVPEEPSPALT